MAENKKAIELKPCPFCGGEAELDSDDLCYWVNCKKCGASVDTSYIEEDVAKEWNKRALLKQPSGEAIALELEKQIQHEFSLFDTEDAKESLPADYTNGYKAGVRWLFMRVKRLLSAEGKQPTCKTCNDTGKVFRPRAFWAGKEMKQPCPACKPEPTGEVGDTELPKLAKAELLRDFYLEGVEKSAQEIEQLQAQLKKQIEHTRTYIQRSEERREKIDQLQLSLQAKDKTIKQLQGEIEANHWIPVSEGLPENIATVWVLLNAEAVGRLSPNIGFYGEDEDGWGWEILGPGILTDVTHWKPITLPVQALSKPASTEQGRSAEGQKGREWR